MKIAQRAEVPQDFVNAMIAAYGGFMTIMSKLAEDRSGQRTVNKHAVTVSRLLPIMKRISPDLRSGLDYEITRLRTLPFTKFEVYRHGEQTYLAGTTKHITLRMWNKPSDIKAELGPYWVAIPIDIFTKPNLASIHMIPMRNPQSRTRHPHHYTTYSTNGDPEPEHPLDRRTGNCYGDYSGPLKGLLDDPDLPALFQQLYGHLTKYGVSPPRSVSSLDFDYTTKESHANSN